MFHDKFFKPGTIYQIETREPSTDLTESSISSANQIAFHPDYKPKVYFDEYEDNAGGNLNTFHQADGVPTSYVWGYNYSYPIAEIKNASYERVKTALGDAVLAELNGSNPGTDEYVQGKLEVLRTHNDLKDALITTFTYKPMVGMRSQKSPAGVVTYFSYDRLNRLELIKDQDGKTVQRQVYHYKQ